MSEDVKLLKYFTEDEFRRSSFCLPSESALASQIQHDPLSLLDFQTLKLLDQTREFAGCPFKITCSFRSRAWDVFKGRSGTGAHPQGFAFDVEARTDHRRFLILRAAILCGWNRIGVAKTYIHLDNAPGLTRQVVWTY